LNKRGPIRGLLCHSCNIKEGKIRKQIETQFITYNSLTSKYGEAYIENIDKLYVNGGVLPMQVD
jgi:hypothetical protein